MPYSLQSHIDDERADDGYRILYAEVLMCPCDGGCDTVVIGGDGPGGGGGVTSEERIHNTTHSNTRTGTCTGTHAHNTQHRDNTEKPR